MSLLRVARNDRVRKQTMFTALVMIVSAAYFSHAQNIQITPANPYHEIIHHVKNAHNLTDEEELHVPVIVSPTNIRAGKPFRIQVIVGKKLHPMTDGHHIEWVEVLVNDMRITLTEITLNGAVPDLEFSLVLQKNSKISVFARCNVHGIWEGNLFVKVRVPTVVPKKTGS